MMCVNVQYFFLFHLANWVVWPLKTILLLAIATEVEHPCLFLQWYMWDSSCQQYIIWSWIPLLRLFLITFSKVKFTYSQYENLCFGTMCCSCSEHSFWNWNRFLLIGKTFCEMVIILYYSSRLKLLHHCKILA